MVFKLLYVQMHTYPCFFYTTYQTSIVLFEFHKKSWIQMPAKRICKIKLEISKHKAEIEKK
jgi:hypothetical protein